MQSLVSFELRVLLKGSVSDQFLFRAFTGELVNNKKAGAYKCVVCGKELFLSDTKFDSRSGWPSFWGTAEDGTVRKIEDSSHGMSRVEVTCADVSFKPRPNKDDSSNSRFVWPH